MSYLSSALAYITATDIDKQFRTTQANWQAMANSATPVFSFLNKDGLTTGTTLEVGTINGATTGDLNGPLGNTTPASANVTTFNATSATTKTIVNTSSITNVNMEVVSPNLDPGANTQFIFGVSNTAKNAGALIFVNIANDSTDNRVELGVAGADPIQFKQAEVLFPKAITVTEGSTLADLTATSASAKNLNNTNTANHVALNLLAPLANGAYTQVIVGKGNSEDNAGFVAYNHVADNDDTNTLEVGLAGNVGTKFGKNDVIIPNHLNVPVGNITQTNGTTQLNHLNSTNGMVGSLIESAALDVGETKSVGTVAPLGASTNFLEVGTPLQVSSQDADNGIMELEVQPGIYMVSASVNLHIGATQNYLLSLGQGEAGLTSASNVVVGPSILLTAQWASGTSYTMLQYPPTVIYASVPLYIKLMLAQTAAARDDLVDPYMCVVRIA